VFLQIVKKGQMSPNRLNKLLYRVGLRLDPKDLPTAFNLFDRRQSGTISLEDYIQTLTLTHYELDLAIEKIRIHLLKGCSNPNDAAAAAKSPRSGPAVAPQARPNAGVLNSGIVNSKNLIGKNIIRENFTLVQVFQMVNTKDDGIFSLDEMMDLAAKVEVFVTEEEARSCLAKMDVDGDDRVEEADFIAFMRQESHAQINKAFRVRECASTLRRWLVRGTTENTSATSTASASTEQWKGFATRYERRTRRKFPGYLDAETLLITMSVLGTHLSALEARELTLLVAPEKNGRVHQADLHAFMGREHRSFGELIALIERELLRDIIDAYRAHDAALTAHGAEDPDLAELYRRKVREVKKAVEKVYLQPPPGAEGDALRASRDTERGEGDEEYYAATNSAAAQDYGSRLKRANLEVISIVQLKDGLEFYFK
jgi:Ca2+-binding EF-hand superfamily protein